MLYKSAVNTAIALSIMISACSAANAEVDGAEIAKRKVEIHTWLLSIYVSERKRPLALAEYQTVVGLSPNDPKLRCQYGQYIFQGGTPADFSSAVIQLKKAVELDPGNAQYNGVLGTLYLKLKKPEEAVKWFKLAVQYGGVEYKKVYEETWKYLQGMKQFNEIKKKQVEQKKLQQQQQGTPGTPGGPKKGGDDDDDW